MIQAVLIDIDNTLLDFDAYVQTTMRDGFETFGIGPYTDDMFDTFTHVNHGLWRQIEEGTLTFQELTEVRWNRVFEALGIVCDGPAFETYFRACLRESAIPVEGAFDLLEHLKGRYVLGVASNGPYEQQLHRLKKGNMFSYFSHYFISEKIGASKPSEQFFSHCLEELGIPAANIVMIGDSLTSDMAGAVAAGMHTCYFDKHKTGIVTDLPLEYTVDSLKAIADFL